MVRIARMRGRAVAIRALKRVKLVRRTAGRRRAEDQYSSASMTVRTRSVTFSSAGSGEP